jgi:DNA-binding transcriptional ArsR family regulator
MKLRKGGLVVARRAGQNSFYRIADPRAAQLAIALKDFL